MFFQQTLTVMGTDHILLWENFCIGRDYVFIYPVTNYIFITSSQWMRKVTYETFFVGILHPHLSTRLMYLPRLLRPIFSSKKHGTWILSFAQVQLFLVFVKVETHLWEVPKKVRIRFQNWAIHILVHMTGIYESRESCLQ